MHYSLRLAPMLFLLACATRPAPPSEPADPSAAREPSSGSASADPGDPAPADCVAEGEATTDLDLTDRPCCPGLHFFYPSPSTAAPEPCPSPDPGPHDGICTRACGDGQCASNENRCSCPRDCERSEPRPAPAPASTTCVREGGRAYTLSEQQCCPGLQFLLETGPPYDGQCIEPPPGPSPGTCVSTCGNGSCDAPENTCNCGADCAAP